MEAIHLKDIPPTDLIIHRIQLCEETRIYNAKYKKLSQNRECWFRRIIEECIDIGIYEKTVLANSCPSKWNINPVFVPKPGQDKP